MLLFILEVPPECIANDKNRWARSDDLVRKTIRGRTPRTRYQSHSGSSHFDQGKHCSLVFCRLLFAVFAVSFASLSAEPSHWSQRMVAHGSSFRMVAGDPRPTSQVAAVAFSQDERSSGSWDATGTSPGPKPRMRPDAVRETAQPSVARLEQALEAVGGVLSIAVEVLKAEFTKARAASKQPAWKSTSVASSAPGRIGGSRSWIHNVPKRVLQGPSPGAAFKRCEAGEFISRYSWSHLLNAQLQPQRSDVVVAGPRLVARRLGAC